jgi:hypothetical protein
MATGEVDRIVTLEKGGGRGEGLVRRLRASEAPDTRAPKSASNSVAVSPSHQMEEDSSLLLR